MSDTQTDVLQDYLSRAVEALNLDADLTFKPMFGGVCAYAQGRVFASLSDIGLALKLPPAAQDSLLRREGARRLQYDESMPPSQQYIVVPPPLAADGDALAVWVTQSLEFVRGLPAPKPRPRKSAA